MEKQLHFFVKENHGYTIWFQLPEPCRKKIQTLLTELIIKYLTSSIKENENHEK
jgi:hypothetical protein